MNSQYHDFGWKLREMSVILTPAALKNVSLAEEKREVKVGARIGAPVGTGNVDVTGSSCVLSRRRTSVCVLAQWK